MKRLTKHTTVEERYFMEFGPVDIDELIEFLKESKEKGATSVDLCYLEEGEIEFDCYYLREESDESYNRRVEDNKQAKQLVEKVKFQEAKEIYLKLKDKYD